jgi:hypothetical protein
MIDPSQSPRDKGLWELANHSKMKKSDPRTTHKIKSIGVRTQPRRARKRRPNQDRRKYDKLEIASPF